jgi:hypothetical protein
MRTAIINMTQALLPLLLTIAAAVAASTAVTTGQYTTTVSASTAAAALTQGQLLLVQAVALKCASTSARCQHFHMLSNAAVSLC